MGAPVKSAPIHDASERNDRRAANLRTAAILGSIALVFFAGIVAAQYSGSATVGIGAVGLVILVFLAVALWRNLRK